MNGPVGVNQGRRSTSLPARVEHYSRERYDFEMSKFPASQILAVCLSFSIVPAAAQTQGNALRNMTAVEVLVESIDADSKACQLDGELIIRSIKYPFSSAKFKTTDAESDTAKLSSIIKDMRSRFTAIFASEQRGETTPEDAAKQSQAASDEYDKESKEILNHLTFYVNILSLYSASTNSCVSDIDAEAYVTQHVNLEATGKTVSAEIKLWSSGGIIGSTRERHRQLLSQEIEDLAKQFVTAWNLDNKAASNSEWPGTPLNKAAPLASEFADLIPKAGKAGTDNTSIDVPPGFTRGPPAAGSPGVKPATAADLPKGMPPLNAASNPSASSTLANSNAPKPDAKTEPEVVTVKYRGPVSLAPFKCDAVTRSSFIERVCYDAVNSYMLIDLTGTWYHYCEIDAGTVSNLMAANSMGQFYNQSIKGRFDCRTHLVPSY